MSNLRYKPSPDHTFWCYSPEGDGMTFWATAEERDRYAAEELRTYLDDEGWMEEVQGVLAGQVTHIATAVDLQYPVGKIDEEGYDEDGEGPWENPDDVRCNYALLPLAGKES